ncbi:hypothetical protein BGW38_006685 [Lunasporangiospora selenospora]|uniref:Uncharacterized protein n=1 Tax=Lunasporangiospora selenospora TaxID=979761 RepID=A0A9P6G3D7_9FUNG|nr:hypothetical protein BGW38_006685 [Lunasporangiospora selenospora]
MEWEAWSRLEVRRHEVDACCFVSRPGSLEKRRLQGEQEACSRLGEGRQEEACRFVAQLDLDMEWEVWSRLEVRRHEVDACCFVARQCHQGEQETYSRLDERHREGDAC